MDNIQWLISVCTRDVNEASKVWGQGQGQSSRGRGQKNCEAELCEAEAEARDAVLTRNS